MFKIKNLISKNLINIASKNFARNTSSKPSKFLSIKSVDEINRNITKKENSFLDIESESSYENGYLYFI